ncbi:MAG: DUF3552 domain-containing protein, partial [Rikenellaceae bacterium]|nr:DUF3552 domain-containing protein [Rikenellaceae bacterium]
MTTLWIIASAAVSAVVVGLLTYFGVNKSTAAKREAILKEAEAQGEVIKKEKILQAKEKFIQMKSEHERNVNERNSKVDQREQRAKQVEEGLQNKQRELDRKNSELDRRNV